MKRCTKCGVEKPETTEYFPKKKGCKNGLNPRCKECISNDLKQWYKKNIDHVKAYRDKNKEIILDHKKRYREANKEAISEYGKGYWQENKSKFTERKNQYYQDNKEISKQYYKDHKEKFAENEKRYRQNNKEHIDEHGRKYRQENKERISEHNKQWANENKDKRNSITNRYRARKRELDSTLTAKQWESIKLYFGDTCAYCGRALPLEQEHFVALSKGGEFTHNNIIPSCRSCNSSKNSKNFSQWYLKQLFFSKKREQKILKYLNYKNEIQQFSLAF